MTDFKGVWPRRVGMFLRLAALWAAGTHVLLLIHPLLVYFLT